MISFKALILFYITTGLYWFSLYTYVPIMSTYSESLGASYKMVGLIIGVYGFTQMLARIPLGILSDKIGKRKPFIIAGIFISVISSLGMYFFRTPDMLLVFRALSGLAAATWVIYAVMFSGFFDSHCSPKAMGFLSSIMIFSQVIGGLVGGIISNIQSPESTFVLSCTAGMLALVAAVRIKESPVIRNRTENFSSVFSVIGKSKLLLFSLLAVFSQLITFSTVYGFTPIAAKNIGANDFQLGLLITLTTLPAAFASLISGSLFVKLLGEKKSITIGFLLMAGGCMVIPFISNLNLLYASQIIAGIGRGMSFPLLMGLSIQNVDETKRATAMGFFQAVYGLGMFAGPVLAGYTGDFAGLTFSFMITGLLGILAALLAFIFTPNTVKKTGQPLECKINLAGK